MKFTVIYLDGKKFATGDAFSDHFDVAEALVEASITIKHTNWAYESESRIILLPWIYRF